VTSPVVFLAGPFATVLYWAELTAYGLYPSANDFCMGVASHRVGLKMLSSRTVLYIMTEPAMPAFHAITERFWGNRRLVL